MVLDYFNLREPPFGVTPDSKYLYLGETHREALASITYGVEAGCGFVALIATPGLGKTTLLFQAMNQLRDKARTVFLFQTVCTPLDLLRSLLSGLGIREFKGSLTEMQLKLKEVLLEEFRLGKRVVVVIDEAQNLDDSVLELVRMLSNFETSREKLIQIVLSGQPELAEKIASPELVQLRQRVSIVARLQPFSAKETALYIEHRLRMAGYSFDVPLFTKDALALIAEHSEGIPRNINNLCFNSLALACALRQKPIDAGIIREVVGDLSLDRFRKPPAAAASKQERATGGIPAFLAAASASPWFTGSLVKVAVAAAIVLALGGTLLGGHRWKAAQVAGPAKSVTPAPAAAPAPLVAGAGRPVPLEPQAAPVGAGMRPAAAANRAPAMESVTNTVQVTPGKTLLRICVDNFGKCDPAILQEIHRLNPALSNPDHIEAGQSIRIPATPWVSRASVTEPGAKPVTVNGAASE
jgi:general secretion pathway protein A